MTDKFIGTPYPIVKAARGFFQKTTGTDSIRADLLALFLTNPTERVMLPTFGIPLNRYIYEPNDPTTAEAVRNIIIDAINTWEPRITVEGIEVTNTVDENILGLNDSSENLPHVLSIKVKFFDPENISDIQELVLEVPLGV